MASQNEQQEQDNFFSYTRYDKQSREVESGKIKTTAINAVLTRNFENWNNFINHQPLRTEITLIHYDEPYSAAINQKFGTAGQCNLRMRVASVFSFENKAKLTNKKYRSASHYTYDIQGNVYKLIQDYPNKFIRDKTIEYDYDLQSGKVNSVTYQPGAPDQFIHRYSYDAINRLLSVETSTDGLIWDTDAEYFYYRHGPLARLELGTDKVQGLDYIYTLQGWTKGVNGITTSPEIDMGQDGIESSLFSNNFDGPGYGALHNPVAQDAFGYVLDYFAQDYIAIHNNTCLTALQQQAGTVNDMYNGNISRMYTQIQDIGNNGFNYTYDQLNRLRSAQAWKLDDNENIAPLANDAYGVCLKYDADGNILRLQRNGTITKPEMDKLQYFYYTQNNDIYNPGISIPADATNKLAYVTDDVASDNYPEDIDNQLSDTYKYNYKYDKIGNLIADKSEEIEEIKWNNYGKVSEIKRIAGSEKPNLKFSYCPMGHRIEKDVIFADATKNFTDYYMRDAQGNIMAIYRKTASNENKGEYELRLKEQVIYGSSRLGVLNSDSLLVTVSPAVITPPLQKQLAEAYYPTKRGYKHYELSNHLGNVLVTISDRKLLVSITENKVEYYYADIVSANDYYAFGMEMPRRKFDSDKYKFGFNGQEKNDEIAGSGNEYSFDFRESDPRLGGQFWSIDPLAKSYPGWSPYAFAQRRPIDGKDIEGLEWKSTTDKDDNPSGYMWDPDNAWNTDETGNKTLKEGYYQQAIFFSENSTFDSDSKYNIGSSTATVFKAEGTTQTFDATTYPSDLVRYTTVPEGRYEATVGLHRSSYTALRMHDIGNTNSQIEMGSSTATGINIHKPGLNNLTGMTSDGIPCSAGCLLVDRDNWDTFIGLFDNDAQKSYPVGITLSRTYSQPVISKYTALLQLPFLNKYLIQPDVTRVYIPIYFDLKMKKL